MPERRDRGQLPGVKQRTAVISDEAWSALRERATLENKSASELCEFLLRHYLDSEEQPVFEISESGARRQRSLYVTDATWAAGKGLAVFQRRPVSALLEQLLRGYLGLDIGVRRRKGQRSL